MAGGPVQHVAVDVIGPEVLERAGQRLSDLGGKVGRGVVRQPVVLAALVGELRLEEKVRPRDDTGAVGSGESLTDSGLEVVSALVRRVNAPEAHPERELGEGRGPVFLPGSAVEKIGNERRTMRWHASFCHGRIRIRKLLTIKSWSLPRPPSARRSGPQPGRLWSPSRRCWRSAAPAGRS